VVTIGIIGIDVKGLTMSLMSYYNIIIHTTSVTKTGLKLVKLSSPIGSQTPSVWTAPPNRFWSIPYGTGCFAQTGRFFSQTGILFPSLFWCWSKEIFWLISWYGAWVVIVAVLNHTCRPLRNEVEFFLTSTNTNPLLCSIILNSNCLSKFVSLCSRVDELT
jgi:hypothetical protein